MVSIVGGTEVNIGHVCVDLSGRDVAVSQHGLNGTRVGAVLQQVRRETVTQRVGRHVFDSHFFRVALDHRPGELSRERFAAVQEDMGQ